MKQILNGNVSRNTHYVMDNSTKKILLGIIIDVKCLKGKRGKKGMRTLVLFFWSQDMLSLLNREAPSQGFFPLLMTFTLFIRVGKKNCSSMEELFVGSLYYLLGD